jgi:hypothetical protein
LIGVDVTDTLIVLDAGLSPGDIEWSLAQTLPPRIAVVRLTPDEIRARGDRPGVHVLEGPDDTAAIVPPLDDRERLFVAAWFQSRQPKARRPGDKLSWDTPGFDPP